MLLSEGQMSDHTGAKLLYPQSPRGALPRHVQTVARGKCLGQSRCVLSKALQNLLRKE